MRMYGREKVFRTFLQYVRLREKSLRGWIKVYRISYYLKVSQRNVWATAPTPREDEEKLKTTT